MSNEKGWCHLTFVIVHVHGPEFLISKEQFFKEYGRGRAGCKHVFCIITLGLIAGLIWVWLDPSPAAQPFLSSMRKTAAKTESIPQGSRIKRIIKDQGSSSTLINETTRLNDVALNFRLLYATASRLRPGRVVSRLPSGAMLILRGWPQTHSPDNTSEIRSLRSNLPRIWRRESLLRCT